MLVELATFNGGDDWGDEVEDGGYRSGSPEEQQWQEPDDSSSNAAEPEDDDGDF